jgi:hypothetical protein
MHFHVEPRAALQGALCESDGYPQVALLAGYAWASLLLALCLGRNHRPLGPVLVSGGVALAVGLALAAIQVAPSVALSLDSVRAPTSFTGGGSALLEGKGASVYGNAASLGA